MSQRPEIDETAMSARVRDYGLNTLSQVASLTMSAVFATAALTFADILRTPDEQAIRMTMWGGGVLFSSLSLIRILHAGLIHSHPSPFQLPLILAWGFLATINFALIALATGGPDGWRTVYLISALLLLIGIALTWAETGAARLDDFVPRLRPAIARRIAESRGIILSGWFGLFASLGSFAAAWHAKAEPEPWVTVLIVINSVTVISLSATIWREIDGFRRFIEDVEQARDAAAD